MAQLGRLYVVATPIGNLEDISLRALSVLESVDKIAAEDTRHSMILLDHHGIHASLLSLHEHNEAQQISKLIHFMQKGGTVALISDAGTPLISDPGYRLVQACHAEGIVVVPVPGACAAIAALSAAGLPTDSFLFLGFLPVKLLLRKKVLSQVQSLPHTLIFYESPRRILSSLTLMREVWGEGRSIVLAKELTKAHETIKPGSIEAVIQWLSEDEKRLKGEFVILVPKEVRLPDEEEPSRYQEVLGILLSELSLKKAVDLTVSLTGCRRKLAYELALNMASEKL